MPLLFDIGAHKGDYTRAHLQTYDKIVLVEPQNYLCEEMKRSLPNKCIVVRAVVSNIPNVPFYINPVAPTISTASKDWCDKSRFQNLGHWVEQKDIPTRTLDSLIAEYGRPDYIKIDVEGYEKSVLLSLSQKCGPLAFEWAEESKADILACLDHLERLGYIEFHLQIEDNFMYSPPSYLSGEAVRKHLESMCQVGRKHTWGMIHCR